jgi:hypothetical protein
MMPVKTPAKSGAPDAKAMPKHKGKATRNTTILEGRSFFKLALAKYLEISKKVFLLELLDILKLCLMYLLKKIKWKAYESKTKIIFKS